MKLLADENIEAAIVDWLLRQGHDVLWAAESHRGASDHQIISIAESQQRVLLTHDLDFGEHVFRQQRCPAGVVLLRLTVVGPDARLDILQRYWDVIEQRSPHHLIVITESAMRIRPMATT